ncbi:hypothetical protein [Archangium sp.]|uniref:hypothetical protein n=1 Tax=Archangium sp. TaxID=1872627 RepID=UPI002D38BAFF|nr:hypothetical protein [Archangium sp.]HYO51314.1 hypothetical protein [Archangium sp.]
MNAPARLFVLALASATVLAAPEVLLSLAHGRPEGVTLQAGLARRECISAAFPPAAPRAGEGAP